MYWVRYFVLQALLIACTAGCVAVDALDTAVRPDTGPSADSDPTDDGRDTEIPEDLDSAGDSEGVDSETPVDDDSDVLSWRSALYPEDWTPTLTSPSGGFLHDFSYAGYHASEEQIPVVTGTEFSVTAYGADASGVADSTVAIQSAIDSAEISGGIVRFADGEFRIDGRLHVAASNVVLRGNGAGRSFLRFTKSTGMSDLDHLTVLGRVSESGEQLLASNAESRSNHILVADASGFIPGDVVHVGWKITPAFIEAHGMTGTWVSFTNQWKPMFRRSVVSVNTASSPHRITLDVPLRYAALTRDGASLRKASGYLREVGIEDLAVTTVATYANAWSNNRSHAILIQGVMDGWIRRVASYTPGSPPDTRGDHLMGGGIKILDSRRFTVAETHLAEAQNRGSGGNGYLFEISRSSEILTVDSSGKEGRHNFIQNWDFGTSGCVWLRTRSESGRSLLGTWDPVGYASYSEYHHSLAMANLVDDSVATDGWQGVNRRGESSGAGHSATQGVFWNVTGGGYLRSLQYGLGYVVGPAGMDLHTDPDALDWNLSGQGTAPEDWVEIREDGLPLEPRSLFEDQLVRRFSD